MSDQNGIDSLPTDQLQVLLTTSPDKLSSRDARAVADFIDRIGGFQNAMLALETLEDIQPAA